MAGSIAERDFVALHGLLDIDHVDDAGARAALAADGEPAGALPLRLRDRRSGPGRPRSSWFVEQTLSDVRECVEYSAADAADAANAEFWKLYWLSDFCNYRTAPGTLPTC